MTEQDLSVTPKQPITPEVFADDEFAKLSWQAIIDSGLFTEEEKATGLAIESYQSMDNNPNIVRGRKIGTYFLEVSGVTFVAEFGDIQYLFPDESEYMKVDHLSKNGVGLFGLLGSYSRTLETSDNEIGVRLEAAGPSANGFNRVMEDVGRIPGEDVFKLVNSMSGNIPDAEYVEALSRGEIPISLADVGYATHDRLPYDHIQSWWAMPPEMITAVRYTANEILEFGDEADARKFVIALDAWQDLTSRFTEKISEFLEQDEVSAKELEEKIQGLSFWLRWTNDEFDTADEIVHLLTDDKKLLNKMEKLVRATILETMVRARIAVAEKSDEWLARRSVSNSVRSGNETLLEAVELVNVWAHSEEVATKAA